MHMSSILLGNATLNCVVWHLSIRRFLTSTATATLVSAFVLSRIDYCNSLLFGSTHENIGRLARISVWDTEVDGSNPGSSMLFH